MAPAVSAAEQVVSASDLTEAITRIPELQRLRGKKTMEMEILRCRCVRSRKKLIACSPKRKFAVAVHMTVLRSC